MEPAAVTNEREERELRRLGRRVAEALEPSAGRAIPAARRRLFDDERTLSARGTSSDAWTGGRWIIGLAAVGAVAAIAFALRDAPTDPTARAVARGGETASPASGVRAAGVSPTDGSRARVEARSDGASELVLESGVARGLVGAQSSGPRAVVAGPYRVTGEAEIEVTWSPDDGLTVHVVAGEARVLAPGQTPSIVPAGATKKLPAELGSPATP